MENPQYVVADESSIRLEMSANSILVADRGGGSDLFIRAEAGEFGPVQPFDPALDVTPTLEPVKAVSRLQAKAALLQMGLLDQVETLVGALDQMTRLAWSEATTFQRDSPLLISLAAYLTWPDGQGLTKADLDALFDLAETIEV